MSLPNEPEHHYQIQNSRGSLAAEPANDWHPMQKHIHIHLAEDLQYCTQLYLQLFPRREIVQKLFLLSQLSNFEFLHSIFFSQEDKCPR